MSFSDFSFGIGSSVHIFSVIVYDIFLKMLLDGNIFFCCTINFISSLHIFSFFFCVNAFYFPKLSSAACEIMVLIFLLLLSG